jgi:chorismate synthase
MSFNTFGHMFRVTTYGESHGPAIGCVVDGCPAGIALTEADIQPYLDKRRPGQSRFTTQRQEPDQVRILSGVFVDDRTGTQVTTGTPIGLMIDNVDQRSKDYSDIRDKYRPGHADYTYDVKYGVRDYRGGGRQSARETAMRVAAGGIARKIVPGMTVRAALIQMGSEKIDRARWDWDEVERNPFFCPDAEKAKFLEGYLDGIRKNGSSVGAVIEVTAEEVPPGLGAPVYGKLDADLAAALMSINAVKGVEIGAGMGAAVLSGDFHRAAGGGALCGQADIFDPDPASQHRSLRSRRRNQYQGPPRPLRRHSRGSHRRSHGSMRDCRPLSTPARPDGCQPQMAI